MSNQEKYYCVGCGKELSEDEIYGVNVEVNEIPYYNNTSQSKYTRDKIEYMCKECSIQNLNPQEAIMYEQIKSRDEQLEQTQQELKEAKTVLHDLGYDDERVKALYDIRHNNALTKDKE